VQLCGQIFTIKRRMQTEEPVTGLQNSMNPCLKRNGGGVAGEGMILAGVEIKGSSGFGPVQSIYL
jgi:hypothetical protein